MCIHMSTPIGPESNFDITQFFCRHGGVDDVDVEARAQLKTRPMDKTRDDADKPVVAVGDVVIIHKRLIFLARKYFFDALERPLQYFC